jgi:hypothetical protein
MIKKKKLKELAILLGFAVFSSDYTSHQSSMSDTPYIPMLYLPQHQAESATHETYYLHTSYK